MKKLIIIFGSIFFLLAVTAGSFFLTKYIDELDPKKNLSDADLLVSVKSWTKSGEDSVVWSFNPDATCRLTTNGNEYFDCTWYLEENILGIKTFWLTELKDEFELHFERSSSEIYFETVSKSDGEQSKFIPTPLETNEE